MTESRSTNGWFEKHVLEKLDTVEAAACAARDDASAVRQLIEGDGGLRERLTRVEVNASWRAALFGGLGAALVAIATLIMRVI